MPKNTWSLLIAVAFATACATQEPAKPAPAPAPAPQAAPEPAPAPKPEPRPEPKPKPVAEKVTFAADVLFDFDKSVVKPDGKSKLDDLAAKVRGVNLEVVIAIGHADSIGSDAMIVSVRALHDDQGPWRLVSTRAVVENTWCCVP